MCVYTLQWLHKGKYISYIGLQLPSTMASSSNTPISYGIQTTIPIPTETALPCCLYNIAITEEGHYKRVCFSTGVQYVPTIHQKGRGNRYLADFVVVTLQSARCTHTVVSGSVVLFTHWTLDAITHVIIAMELLARYIYIYYNYEYKVQ